MAMAVSLRRRLGRGRTPEGGRAEADMGGRQGVGGGFRV
eukprot:CAMPEP_0172075810 /NCGR_PEP_ID=MMETSP1043-20130122/16154_1 /TAXON_ID=464988 /ORGANISM="Hemiselmis andersenii, Strain CCMP441" /LENGTH=38 /DNA_ID= /DNA_START= /DNA_END= /DNA_ORIENTATION=